MAFEPPPTHATTTSGTSPNNSMLCARASSPITRWNWRTRNPNTYAIALNVGPYEVIEGSYKSRFGNTIPLHYWYIPGPGATAKAKGTVNPTRPR